jgi:putative ABC transport system permease protein
VNAATAGALLRIGRRNIARSRWRSLLVVVLVLLPVSAMVAATTIMQTVTPTPERVATHAYGAADLLVYEGPGGSLELLRSRLPAGSQIEPLLQRGADLAIPGMSLSITLASYDPQGLGRGLLTLVSGRFPGAAGGEAAITAEVARLAGVTIGDRINVAELGSLQVVGFVEDELRLTARTVMVDASVARAAVASKEAVWMVGLPAGVDVDVADLGSPVRVEGPPQEGGFDPNQALIVNTRASVLSNSSAAGPATVVLGALALVDAALVAAAAFAVGVRRRQRELGLMAATGAEPRHLTGSVLAEAVVLGALGALAGAVLGLIAALIASPFLDDLTGIRNPSITPDLPLVVVAGFMGLAAALVAAIAPAWTAARLPVLAALSGRRPPNRSARRSLVVGLVVIAVATGLTALGAEVLRERGDSSLSLILLLTGAVLGTLGFGACSPFLLELLERPATRLSLAPRIALRDTARARSRNGPIVTALLAAFAATVALAAYQSSQDSIVAANWRPSMLPEQIVIEGSGVSQAGPEAARALGAAASAPILGAVAAGGPDGGSVWIAPDDSDDPNAALSTANLTVGDAELLRALGAEAAAADFASGSVIWLSQKASAVTRATIHVLNADGSDADRVVLPARALALGLGVGDGDLPGAVISVEAAKRVGILPGTSNRFVIRLSHAVTDADLATAAANAARYPDTFSFASRPPIGAGAAFRAAMIVASLLFALTVTAVAVALGEAESRAEQRTLLAIGADPGLRRRIAASRAGVIALLGGLLAVPAGLLPIWGLLASRGYPLVVPVQEVVGAVALLPLLAIAGTWLLSRPIPDWSAFRAEGA